MSTIDGDNRQSVFAKYIGGPSEKERPEPKSVRTGRDTVQQWMLLCIGAGAIKVEEAENPRAINLGSEHAPAWIATDFLFESYLATCRQQEAWYPVNNRLFGRVLTEILGPAHRSIVVPETMFRPGKRPRRPWGHFVPNGEIWQELLDARLRVQNRAIPKLTRLMKVANKLLHDSRVGSS